jgi:hypothetical protein
VSANIIIVANGNLQQKYYSITDMIDPSYEAVPFVIIWKKVEVLSTVLLALFLAIKSRAN